MIYSFRLQKIHLKMNLMIVKLNLQNRLRFKQSKINCNRKWASSKADPIEESAPIEELMKPKEAVEQEADEQPVDLESLEKVAEEAEPVQRRSWHHS